MALVKIEGVSKVFKEASLPVQALTSIHVEIQKGEFTAFCGPSGSGKTTLLNLIGCLDRPSEGKVHLENEEVSSLAQGKLATIRRRKIGFIFQDFNLIPTLTVRENIEYVLWLQGETESLRRQKSKALAERFGIGKLLSRRPAQISRGQQQRVACARAIIHKPLLIIGDELTANLDHKTGAELMDFIKKLNREEGLTFLYATHDPIMMERASRVVRMQDGRIIDGKG
ncbi:MAG: ABC transporter ATP-binding protein [Candidatus Omnitrophica bacterium]|nr:ABC transporter ATP-binding protein [Candidatus Omnitrophota bacterium]